MSLGLVEKRLGEAHYLAGNAFTAPDIVTIFSLTTMRLYLLFGPTPYPNILSYLQRIGMREAYRRPMQKADPDMAPMLN